MPTEAETLATIALNSKLKATDEFISSFAASDAEFTTFLSHLNAKKVIKLVIKDLWDAYTNYDYPEKDPEFAQLSLIFHGFMPPEVGKIDFIQVVTLMLTGKIDGKTPLGVPSNLFPACFWSLSVVKECLIHRTQEVFTIMAQTLCEMTYELPENWDDKEAHTEGIFISIEDQTILLLEGVSETLIEESKELLNPQPEVEPEEETEEPVTGPDGDLEGDLEGEGDQDMTPPEGDKTKD